MRSGPGRRLGKKADGEEASLQLSSLPLDLFGRLKPTPPPVRYPMDTKVGESLFWTNHLVFYMHKLATSK